MLAAVEDKGWARLDMSECELIFKMGFMTESELESIEYIPLK